MANSMMRNARQCEPVLAVAEEVKVSAAPEEEDPIAADQEEGAALRPNKSMTSM
jgi:hypothetical protein